MVSGHYRLDRWPNRDLNIGAIRAVGTRAWAQPSCGRYAVHQESGEWPALAALEHLGKGAGEFVDIRNPRAHSRLHWQLPAGCV
jgi:hypothetical protein